MTAGYRQILYTLLFQITLHTAISSYIRPQDVSMKVNGFSVEGWSQESPAKFFTSPSRASSDIQEDQDDQLLIPLLFDISTYDADMMLPGSSEEESGSSTFYNVRNRHSVDGPRLKKRSLEHFRTTNNQIRLYANTNNFLKLDQNNQNTVSHGPHPGGSSTCEVCWKLNHFRGGSLGNEGLPVIIETQQGGRYLHVPSNSPSALSITDEDHDMETLDDRHFVKINFDHESAFALKHHLTGKYISTGADGRVHLISGSSNNLPNTAKFTLIRWNN